MIQAISGNHCRYIAAFLVLSDNDLWQREKRKSFPDDATIYNRFINTFIKAAGVQCALFYLLNIDAVSFSFWGFLGSPLCAVDRCSRTGFTDHVF